MECSHLLDNIKLHDSKVEYSVITKDFSCSECSEKEQNWLCLQCGVVNCGRYKSGHAKLHAEVSDHQLCMSCEMYSVYCYKCDDFVSNNDIAIDRIRKSVMKMNEEHGVIEQEGTAPEKSDTALTKTCQDVEEVDKSDVLEVETEIFYVDVEDDLDVTPSSSTFDTGNDTSESKPSKKNSEELGRSLRPRSRKLTLSSDSGSIENLQLTKKTKKSTSYNGKSQKEKRVVGLKNLGNTCFMNAVLQSLNNIQEFSYYFSQLPSLETKSNGRKVYHSRSYTRQEMQDVVMAEELRKVLISLNSGCGSKGAISPECLFLVIWKVVPRFRGYQQQDAHEFLRYILDRLHTELLQLLPPEKAEGGIVSKTPSASIVTAVFGGTLQSEVRCLACGTQSKKFDPFLDLSLELPDNPNDTPVSLIDCLASFVQVEELADTERYFCSSCKCKQISTKQFWIHRLPNVLCLHLKRFRWYNYFRTKVDTTISFPLQALDVSKFVLGNVPETRCSENGNYLYDLAAVIVHHGSGTGCGHYTAFAINDDQWFHFNDQNVRAAEPEAVADCKPYIMFYIRREISSPVLPTS